MAIVFVEAEEACCIKAGHFLFYIFRGTNISLGRSGNTEMLLDKNICNFAH